MLLASRSAFCLASRTGRVVERLRTNMGRSSTKMPIVDERTARTRAKIAHAIIGLGRQQPIDSITVGQLSREAGISRSTFYAHYGSLRDYLTRSYARMLE